MHEKMVSYDQKGGMLKRVESDSNHHGCLLKQKKKSLDVTPRLYERKSSRGPYLESLMSFSGGDQQNIAVDLFKLKTRFVKVLEQYKQRDLKMQARIRELEAKLYSS